MSSSLVVASGSLGKQRNISGKPVKLCVTIFSCDQSPKVLADTSFGDLHNVPQSPLTAVETWPKTHL